jgi:hypothetical protein
LQRPLRRRAFWKHTVVLRKAALFLKMNELDGLFLKIEIVPASRAPLTLSCDPLKQIEIYFKKQQENAAPNETISSQLNFAIDG